MDYLIDRMEHSLLLDCCEGYKLVLGAFKGKKPYLGVHKDEKLLLHNVHHTRDKNGAWHIYVAQHCMCGVHTTSWLAPI